jgi:hypothetical protein
MTFRTMACCAALLGALFAPAAQAAPCDGSPCPAAQSGKVAKPLQLGQFMRPGAIPVSQSARTQAANAPKHAAKPATHATVAHAAKPVTHASKQHAAKPVTHAAKAIFDKPKKALVLRKRVAPPDETDTTLATEAAAAFAAQHEPEVRVVAADELNEIDLAAEAAAPETVGLAPGGQDEVRVADATPYSNVDRQGDQEAPPVSAPDPVGEPRQSDHADLTWIQRFWAMLHYAVATVAAGWRALFG